MTATPTDEVITTQSGSLVATTSPSQPPKTVDTDEALFKEFCIFPSSCTPSPEHRKAATCPRLPLMTGAFHSDLRIDAFARRTSESEILQCIASPTYKRPRRGTMNRKYALDAVLFLEAVQAAVQDSDKSPVEGLAEQGPQASSSGSEPKFVKAATSVFQGEAGKENTKQQPKNNKKRKRAQKSEEKGMNIFHVKLSASESRASQPTTMASTGSDDVLTKHSLPAHMDYTHQKAFSVPLHAGLSNVMPAAALNPAPTVQESMKPPSKLAALHSFRFALPTGHGTTVHASSGQAGPSVPTHQSRQADAEVADPIDSSVWSWMNSATSPSQPPVDTSNASSGPSGEQDGPSNAGDQSRGAAHGAATQQANAYAMVAGSLLSSTPDTANFSLSSESENPLPELVAMTSSAQGELAQSQVDTQTQPLPVKPRVQLRRSQRLIERN